MTNQDDTPGDRRLSPPCIRQDGCNNLIRCVADGYCRQLGQVTVHPDAAREAGKPPHCPTCDCAASCYDPPPITEEQLRSDRFRIDGKIVSGAEGRAAAWAILMTPFETERLQEVVRVIAQGRGCTVEELLADFDRAKAECAALPNPHPLLAQSRQKSTTDDPCPELCQHDDSSFCTDECREKARQVRAWRQRNYGY